jgi:penicillin-binding protein 2
VLAPYPNPRVVVTVTVEQGGFGVESAAPIARAILERYFSVNRAAAGSVNTAAAHAAGPG